MNLKSTLHRFVFVLTLCLGASFMPANAQYCSPTFANGCSLWNTQTVTLGSLNWSLGSDPCTNEDYTFLSANLTTGVPHLLTVTNGSWCGCAVWIDFNQDYNFDASEVMFYNYQANVNNTYNIYLTINNGTPVGTYRMRIISPWGSDGFLSTNTNGYGPCGAFQYGSCQDFSIVITGPQGTEDLSGKNESAMSASFNPETNQITVLLNSPNPKEATLQLLDISGRVVETRKARSEKEILDVSGVSSGIYILNYNDGAQRQSIRLSK